MARYRALCLSLSTTLFVIILGVTATAQSDDPAFIQGIKPYGAYHGGHIDTISLENGKLDLHIPLLSYPQRGDLQMNFTIRYNNPQYSVNQECIPRQACYYYASGPSSSSAVNVIPDFAAYGLNVGQIILPDYSIRPTGFISGTNWESLDATGWAVQDVTTVQLPDGVPVTEGVIVDPDGIRRTVTNNSNSQVYVSTIEDRNGNKITGNESGWTDSLGRSIPPPPGYPLGQAGGSPGNTALCPTTLLPVSAAYSWNVPATTSAGGTATYTFCYAQVQLNLTGLPGPTPLKYYTGVAEDLQSIVLPNGQSWNFSYDSYGILTQITLPTGGTISYGWGMNYPCRPGPELPVISYPAAGSRSVDANDGTGPHTWTYTGNFATTPGTSVARTITDPLGNYELHGLTALASNSCSVLETEVSKYQNSSLVQTIDTSYSFNTYAVPNTDYVDLVNVVPAIITTTWPDGLTKSVTKTYDSGFTWVGAGFQHGIYGRTMSETESDYGSGTAGPVLRRTVYNYQAFANPNYLAYNLLDPLVSVIVYDSASNTCNGVAGYCAYTYYGYDETGLQSSTITTQRDPNPPNASYRGNQTSVHRWMNGTTVSQSPCGVPVVSNGYLVSNKVYYDTGEVQQSSDPCGYPTIFQYSPAYQGAFPTTVINALNRSFIYTYDSNTGAVTSIQDPNLQTTTKSYDILTRLTSVSYPDGGSTRLCYSDTLTSFGGTCQSGPPFQVVQSKAITASLNETSTVIFDGLGRVSQTQLNSDPTGTDYTLITYDALGRKSIVYNPTRCSTITSNCKNETTWGFATTNYDALGRVTSVVEQDGSTVTTDYSAFPCTTVTDEVGNTRKSCVDGLGRMTGVWEDPGSSPHLNYETDYTYDALGNLENVNQKGSNASNARTRSFSYDSLSELTSATNPESGTILYAYDADGNVITKTAPLPNQTGTSTVTTTLTYDKLNRLTKKTYKDGNTTDPYTPPVQYGYDGVALTGCTITPPGDPDTYPIGRRTSICDGSGGASWKHDKMGRILQERRTIGSASGDYDTDAYNLDGSVQSITALGYSVAYTYNAARQPTKVENPADPFNYVTSATYAPTGGVTAMSLGAAPITVSNAYNDRLQPILLSASTTSATLFSECFDFHLGVTVSTSPCSFSAYASGNNGNVYQIVNNRDSTRSQSFTYDVLNRIKSGQSSGTQWGETFTIDAWGNLTNEAAISGKTNHEGLNASAGTNNRLSGFGYDAAGNVTSNGSASYVYDAENRLIATAGTSYIYDDDGNRVEKCTEGTTPGTCASGATGTLYWRGMASDPLAETDLSGNVLENYIFIGGQRIARRDASTKAVHFYFSDHLGSHGVVENATGTTCEQDIDYYPFGGQENDYCPNATQHYKFTGKERDSESGLDYFGVRYNTSSMGRFMSPDSIAYSDLQDPQSLNLYSYVGNHPTFLIDPDGRCWRWLQGACDLFKNTGQRFDNLFHGEGFHTDKGVEDVAHRNNARNREREVNATASKPLGQQDSIGIGTLLGVLVMPYLQVERALQNPAPNCHCNALGVGRILPPLTRGTKVYRVWGGKSGPNGRSWTRVDPRTVENYRGEAGLPNENTGEYLSQGELTNTEGVTVTTASELDGNPGGLDEVVVPDAEMQIGDVVTEVLAEPF